MFRKYGKKENWERGKADYGFTLMEIIVATTIFALVMTALMSIFNYTLKINRRGEALRQATQGMRNLTESIVKDVRNGSINYGVINYGTLLSGRYAANSLPPCSSVTISLGSPAGSSVSNTYALQENKLGVINSEGEEECYYLAYGPGNTGGHAVGDPVPNGVFKATAENPAPVLALKKGDASPQIMTPPNFRVEQLSFFIRPLCDPYSLCADYGGVTPNYQPFVEMNIQFAAQLTTGERVPIYYQTAVTTMKYDIPRR